MRTLFGLIVALTLTAPAFAQNASIQAQGTTNLTPLLTKAAAAYEAAHPDVHIAVKGTSSGAGIASLKNGDIDIAASDVAVSDPGFVDTTLGVVGFAFVANADAGVKNLNRQQLMGIFAGKITNWKQVGGNDLPITIISRDIGTGTRLVLEQKVAKTLIDTKVVANANEVIKAVQSTSGALGYVATYFVGNHTDMVVTYNGIEPTIENIRNHSYAFSTDEHLYVRTDAKSQARDFVSAIASNKDLLQSAGIY
jgi:phosphate transport system substrate-binding protein